MHKYYRAYFLFMIIASAMALLVAYYLEVHMGLYPCKLCQYQRIAYVVAILFCLMGYYSVAMKKISGVCVVLAFGMGTYLAFMHVGVEFGWFPVDVTCTNEFKLNPESTLEDFKKVIEGQVLAPCDRTPYSFIWISIAGWNLIYSTALFFFSFITITTFLLKANYKYYD